MALPVALLKLAWKFLGPAATALAMKWGEEGFQRLRDIIRTKQAERRVQAQQKAQAAEAQACQADDATEAAALRAQAQVWRAVAQQYAQDNKVLQAELDHLRTDLKIRQRGQVHALPLSQSSVAHTTPSAPNEPHQPKIQRKQ